MKRRVAKSQFLYPLPDEVYENLAIKIYEPLLLKENVVVALPPLFGKDHAVRYLWERHQDRLRVLGDQAHLYHEAHIPLAFVEADNNIQWINQILQGLGAAIPNPSLENLKAFLQKDIDDGYEPTLFFNIPEALPDLVLGQFFYFAQTLYYLAPNKIHFIIIMDHKWNADEFFTMVTPFRSLFQHLVEPTLYSDEQVRYFIQYWTHKWQFQLTDDIEELIIKEAGGILLLAKAVIRLGKTYSMQTRAELFQALRSHQDYKLQIQLFVNRLTKTQQTILSNPNSLTDREREAAHLRAMGILRLTAQGYRIRSLSVERFIHPEILSDVLYQTVNDQVRLSKTEDILLRLFVDHEGQTIPREAVANLLHNNIPNSPSDWAIDQAISRLRKKLSTTNLAASATIITKKKIGFLFQRL